MENIINFYASFTTGFVGALSFGLITLTTTIQNNINECDDATLTIILIVTIMSCLGEIFDFFTPPEFKFIHAMVMFLNMLPFLILVIKEIIVSLVKACKSVYKKIFK